MQKSCCTSTLRRDSLMTAIARTDDVSKISPSGTMPTRAATVERIDSRNSMPLAQNMLANSKRPTGMITMLTNLMMLFKLVMISELISFWALASAEIFAA